MSKILSVIFAALLAFPVHASELDQGSLQGNWLITELMGESATDGDLWRFEGNQFYQEISGMRVPPDEFAISPGVIDLGYAKIKVISYDGKIMEAVMGGAKYKLVKQ